MAQTVAFQFWLAYMENKEDAWKRYLEFTDKAGTKTFEEVVSEAGLFLPYGEGGMKKICESVGNWIKAHQI